jgi:carbonic anhydrase
MKSGIQNMSSIGEKGFGTNMTKQMVLKSSFAGNFVLAIYAVALLSGPLALARDVPVPPVYGMEKKIQDYRQRQDHATPASVLDWLKEGNSRFAKGKSKHGGYPTDARERIKVAAQGQRPLAAILSCIDSRTTPELTFDTSVGDLFTARIGANVVNDDILGSLEIAVESGAKVIVVLGHTDCGGIKGACSGLELGHMTQLLERVKPAIHTTNTRLDNDPVLSKTVGERVVGNRRYIAEIGHDNAEQSADQLLSRSSILREKVQRGEILLVPAVFNVDTGVVTFK